MAFQGSTVYLCQDLVSPKQFDDLKNILKDNGADLHLYFNASANAANDYHVIASSNDEKFKVLSEQGCNMIGPECILQCAKEQKSFPKQRYTCCLAMHGVKLLASGFDRQEKENIHKFVTSMCGELQTKISLDVDFVIAKDVLSNKCQWAFNVLKKPVLIVNWLLQCNLEHRLVPYEPYRMPPFKGLTICVSGIFPGRREKIEHLVVQNGGRYSPNLTKRCTHLVCNRPEGEKHVVAQKWGHIKVVNEKWILQSIVDKACVNEELYPVVAGIPSDSVKKCNSKHGAKQVKVNNVVQTVASATSLTAMQTENVAIADVKCFVSGVSEEGDDLYLENCKIFLVGFQPKELQTLVHMVRTGGGSRYTTLHDNLTHVVVGRPTYGELREIRRLLSMGITHVVRPLWLEDCTKHRREIEVMQQHAFFENSMSQGPDFCGAPNIDDLDCTTTLHASEDPNENPRELNHQRHEERKNKLLPQSDEEIPGSLLNIDASIIGKKSCLQQKHHNDFWKYQDGYSLQQSNVFNGYKFLFSENFPNDKKEEVIQWVLLGEGGIVDYTQIAEADFMIGCHGSRMLDCDNGHHFVLVSTIWIQYSFLEGKLLDVKSHILYKPLPCQVPLPGFENMYFSITQYEMKDRSLLQSLCHIIGSKFTENLTRNVTHLLCKFCEGPKYEAARAQNIEIISADWITECILQDRIVAYDNFRPLKLSKGNNVANNSPVNEHSNSDGD